MAMGMATMMVMTKIMDMGMTTTAETMTANTIADMETGDISVQKITNI